MLHQLEPNTAAKTTLAWVLTGASKVLPSGDWQLVLRVGHANVTQLVPAAVGVAIAPDSRGRRRIDAKLIRLVKRDDTWQLPLPKGDIGISWLTVNAAVAAAAEQATEKKRSDAQAGR